jgi:hypothetical protein
MGQHHSFQVPNLSGLVAQQPPDRGHLVAIDLACGPRIAECHKKAFPFFCEKITGVSQDIDAPKDKTHHVRRDYGAWSRNPTSIDPPANGTETSKGKAALCSMETWMETTVSQCGGCQAPPMMPTVRPATVSSRLEGVEALCEDFGEIQGRAEY